MGYLTEVKVLEYDEMTFIIPVDIEEDFIADVFELHYLPFLEKWEKYKRNPADVKLYMRED